METVKLFKGIRAFANSESFYRKIEEEEWKNDFFMSYAIERNVIIVAAENDDYGRIIAGGAYNVFDGSVVAMVVGRIIGRKIEVVTLADVFISLLGRPGSKHYCLGNNKLTLDGLSEFVRENYPDTECHYVPLPYCEDYRDFDFEQISKDIQHVDPDFIWVSLGAPKQEFVIRELSKHLRRGIAFGVGAVFNFYSVTTTMNRAPLWMRKNKLEWLYRLQESPAKNLRRNFKFLFFITRLTKLIRNESSTYRR